MCGPNSALGLDQRERELWPQLRDRLREPGRLMAMMRGVLGGDSEVAVLVTVTPEGVARPVAILVTPPIEAEIELSQEGSDDLRRGRIGDDDVEVVMGSGHGEPPHPIALLTTDWMREHLYLYARELWHRPRR